MVGVVCGCGRIGGARRPALGRQVPARLPPALRPRTAASPATPCAPCPPARCPAFKLLTYYGGIKERAAKRQGWSKPNAFHVCITSYTLVLQVGGVV